MADAASGEGEAGEKVYGSCGCCDAFREMRTERRGPTDNNDMKTLPGDRTVSRLFFTHIITLQVQSSFTADCTFFSESLFVPLLRILQKKIKIPYRRLPTEVLSCCELL